MNTPHQFWDLFESAARTVLAETSSPSTYEIDKVIAAIQASKTFAMYPCNRYSRKIICRIEEQHPELLKRLTGVFDKSENFNFRNDVPLYHLRDIQKIEFDTLVVSTSKFPEDLLPDIYKAGVPKEKIFITSYFREQLSHMDPDELIDKVKSIANLLADKKSRITYLLTWLSLLLLDKDILSVYHQSVNMTYQPSGTFEFNNMTLKHLHEFSIQASLNLEIYRMEYVSPATDDIVFDIGAYRGDTVAYFHKYLKNTGHIYAFEPDSINYGYLQENINNNSMTNVTPVNEALLEKEKNCHLIATPESGSFLYIMKDGLDTDAFTEVQATTIDAFMVRENIPRLDFIKSDIEGCELAMLKGGENTIVRHAPKMALAIYHSIEDLIEVPLLVHQMNPDYQLYLRHWNFEGSPWEILLYATTESPNP